MSVSPDQAPPFVVTDRFMVPQSGHQVLKIFLAGRSQREHLEEMSHEGYEWIYFTGKGHRAMGVARAAVTAVMAAMMSPRLGD